MPNAQGCFLVASPHLPDPNFYRSVVLMVEHSDEGALGVILNRVSNTSLRTIWSNVSDSNCVSDQHLFVGGPVEGPLMAIHRNPQIAGIVVLPGLFFTSDKSSLERLVESTDSHFRIFSGYAGWGPGQLDEELAMGGWLVAPARSRQVLGDCDELWQSVTHSIGAEITDQALNIRHIPADPRSN